MDSAAYPTRLILSPGCVTIFPSSFPPPLLPSSLSLLLHSSPSSPSSSPWLYIGNGSQFLALSVSIILLALMGMFNVHR